MNVFFEETDDKSRKLVALANEDFSDVIALAHAKMRKAGDEPMLTVQEAEEALRQYYALAIIAPDMQQYGVSSEVDKYWHWHLLDTKTYHEMCGRVFGCFMHHKPLMPGDEVEFQRVRSVYEKSRAVLASHFDLNERAWPKLDGTQDEHLVVCLMYDDPAIAA